MRGVKVSRGHFLGWLPSQLPGREFMLCAWSDCAANARGDFQATIPGHGPGKAETYAFCSQGHLTRWLRSPRPE